MKEKGKVRSYNAEQVMQVDINRVLHLLYLDAKAEEQLQDWNSEEDYHLGYRSDKELNSQYKERIDNPNT